MLVLLVIVLTTATFVAKGMIPIDLSEAKSATKITKEDILTITITKNHDIFFNKKIISKQNISEHLQKYKTTTPIKINCDKNIKFQEFVFVIDILKEKSYTNLAIVTKYE